MADKITLDFEKNLITFDTDSEKGTEYNSSLSERKEAILKAMGYELVDITKEINAINEFINGEITEEELEKSLEE